MSRGVQTGSHHVRYWIVLTLLASGLVVIGARAAYLQVVVSEYLQRQGDSRYLRTVSDNAHRGMILDRNGEPLAISTPVESVWVHPATFANSRDRWPALTKLLGLRKNELRRVVKRARAPITPYVIGSCLHYS